MTTQNLPDTSRRTVLKGAAWAMPVIAATTMAPTLAATEAPEPDCTTPWTNFNSSWFEIQTAAIPSAADGWINIQYDPEVGSGCEASIHDYFEMRIYPKVRGGRSWSLTDYGTHTFLRTAGITTDHLEEYTRKRIPFKAVPSVGDIDKLKWSFGGYTSVSGVDDPVRLELHYFSASTATSHLITEWRDTVRLCG